MKVLMLMLTMVLAPKVIWAQCLPAGAVGPCQGPVLPPELAHQAPQNTPTDAGSAQDSGAAGPAPVAASPKPPEPSAEDYQSGFTGEDKSMTATAGTPAGATADPAPKSISIKAPDIALFAPQSERPSAGGEGGPATRVASLTHVVESIASHAGSQAASGDGAASGAYTAFAHLVKAAAEYNPRAPFDDKFRDQEDTQNLAVDARTTFFGTNSVVPK